MIHEFGTMSIKELLWVEEHKERAKCLVGYAGEVILKIRLVVPEITKIDHRLTAGGDQTGPTLAQVDRVQLR